MSSSVVRPPSSFSGSAACFADNRAGCSLKPLHALVNDCWAHASSLFPKNEARSLRLMPTCVENREACIDRLWHSLVACRESAHPRTIAVVDHARFLKSFSFAVHLSLFLHSSDTNGSFACTMMKLSPSPLDALPRPHRKGGRRVKG